MDLIVAFLVISFWNVLINLVFKELPMFTFISSFIYVITLYDLNQVFFVYWIVIEFPSCIVMAMFLCEFMDLV